MDTDSILERFFSILIGLNIRSNIKYLGIELKEKTILEKACSEIMGKDFTPG